MQEDHAIEVEKSESALVELLVPFMGCAGPFGDTSGDRCLIRGLLPGHLLDVLRVLQFLSLTVISAQKAQRKYGVRASVLLAMAMDEFCFDVRDLARDPKIVRELDGERTISPNIDRWFLRRAKQLTKTEGLRVALRSASVEGYIGQICDLGFGGSMKAMDLWANVENYHLQDCDAAGMISIGEYSREKYDEVKDAAGNLTGLQPNLYWAHLRKARGGELAA